MITRLIFSCDDALLLKRAPIKGISPKNGTRIRALLRRESSQKQSCITIGNLNIDFSSRNVEVDNNAVKLTAKEFELLELLIFNANTILTRYQISEHLNRDFDHLSASNIVDAHIKNLRKKLSADELIETVRGVGYRIVL